MDGIKHLPVDGILSISSPYGYRNNPITGVKGTFHAGVDIRRSKTITSNIYCVADGTIYDKGYNNIRGYWVKVIHGNASNTWYTLYQHMQKDCLYNKHDNVNYGTIIGYIGSTGSSTASHLHFEIHDMYKSTVDPEPYINNYYERVKEEEEMTESEVKSIAIEVFNNLDPCYDEIHQLPKSLQEDVQWLVDNEVLFGNGKTTLGSIRYSAVVSMVIALRLKNML